MSTCLFRSNHILGSAGVEPIALLSLPARRVLPLGGILDRDEKDSYRKQRRTLKKGGISGAPKEATFLLLLPIPFSPFFRPDVCSHPPPFSLQHRRLSVTLPERTFSRDAYTPLFVYTRPLFTFVTLILIHSLVRSSLGALSLPSTRSPFPRAEGGESPPRGKIDSRWCPTLTPTLAGCAYTPLWHPLSDPGHGSLPPLAVNRTQGFNAAYAIIAKR